MCAPATRITPTPTAPSDSDFNTAWIYTRANNQEGQQLQIDFGRQVTLTQIRVIGGFDATAPDGTDQWSKDRIVTKPRSVVPEGPQTGSGHHRHRRCPRLAFHRPEPTRHGQQAADPGRRNVRPAPTANADK